MRDNTFTPGPWEAEHADGPTSEYAKASTGVWSKKKHAAAVDNYEHRPMDEAWICGIWGEIDDEDLANARLIAAAPDMYDALWETIELSDRNLTEAGRTPECQRVYDIVRTALRKAEGE